MQHATPQQQQTRNKEDGGESGDVGELWIVGCRFFPAASSSSSSTQHEADLGKVRY
jgi:hypothetical protein